MICNCCGREVGEFNSFCKYCGADLRTVYTVEKKKDNHKVARIVGIIGLVFIFICFATVCGAVFLSTQEVKQVGSNASQKHHKKNHERIEDSYSYDDDDYDFTDDDFDEYIKQYDPATDTEVGKSLAKELEEINATDMSGKTLYFSHDGKTKAGSYWEFYDDENCKLVFQDGGYYLAKYTVMEDELGMYYTELAFPSYYLTYDELKETTDANKESYDNCNGYVVLAFKDIQEYTFDGELVESEEEAPEDIFFYGVTFDNEDGTLYEVVGGNSAEYYYFLDFKDDTI